MRKSIPTIVVISFCALLLLFQNCGESTIEITESSSTGESAPTILQQPQASSVQYLRSSELSVVAEGDGLLSYDWYLDGILIGNGNILSINELLLEDQGNYYVVISNEFGSITSESIEISPELHVSCKGILDAGRSDGDGNYYIDPDGEDFGVDAFEVYCDMTIDGGGWTLVDNDASIGSTFTSRQPGANPDPTVTRGSYLPAYTWSAVPQLMVRSSFFNGTVDWVTMNALNAVSREYPTQTIQTASHGSAWSVGILNGNTNRGTTSWIYNGGNNFGSVWIGNGTDPTVACGYAAAHSGLGNNQNPANNTCSTWVR